MIHDITLNYLMSQQSIKVSKDIYSVKTTLASDIRMQANYF